MNKFLSIVLLTIVASCHQPTSSLVERVDPGTVLVRDSLTDELNEIHQRGFINGFGVAIVDEDEVLYTKGIGYSNVQDDQSYTEETIQNIGSVSKTFIGLALMKAQQLGQLKLDDPIANYLPFEVQNPAFPAVPITIRHLATHTSTILDTDYYDEKTYLLKDDVVVSDSLTTHGEVFNPASSKEPLLSFLERMLSEDGDLYEKTGFLENQPGEIYEYSNVGATLAAAILEVATGKPFKDFATEHILKPLDMGHSGWSFDDVNMELYTTLYINPTTALPYYSLITYPDGGLITSPSDLGKYLSELIKGHAGEGVLLSKESYGELFAEQLSAEQLPGRSTESAYDDEYNSGIFMGFTPGGFVGHTGGDPGVATYMFFNPATKVGRLLMINTSVGGSPGGVDEFYAIWNKLGEYEAKLSSAQHGK